MRKKVRGYVISTLQNKIEIWMENIRKITKSWTRKVEGIKPFTFAVPYYDRFTLEKGEDGKMHRVYPKKVKRPDSVEVVNEGNNFYVLVRKKERVLTAVLAWNEEARRYQFFLSTGKLAKVGEKANNKTHWLHLMIRRCLILTLRKLSLAHGGYRKNEEDKGSIRVDYFDGLSTYYALVGIPIQRKEQLGTWCGLNILAWKKYLAATKDEEENRERVRAMNALKKLKKFCGRAEA